MDILDSRLFCCYSSTKRDFLIKSLAYTHQQKLAQEFFCLNLKKKKNMAASLCKQFFSLSLTGKCLASKLLKFTANGLYQIYLSGNNFKNNMAGMADFGQT